MAANSTTTTPWCRSPPTALFPWSAAAGTSGPGFGPGNGFTVNGQITGPGGLGVAWDGGTLVLSGSNNYQGATTIGTNANSYYNNSGANPTLQLGNNNALPGGDLIFGSNANQNTPTLDMNGFNATVGKLTGGTNAVVDIVSSGGASTLTVGNNNASSTFTGVIQNSTGMLGLSKIGNGTLTLGSANTYGGGTTISGGILNINGDGALGAAASGLTFSSAGTLQAGAGGIALNSARGLTVNNGVTATIDTQANNMTIAGVIGGPGAVTKIGGGAADPCRHATSTPAAPPSRWERYTSTARFPPATRPPWPPAQPWAARERPARSTCSPAAASKAASTAWARSAPPRSTSVAPPIIT